MCGIVGIFNVIGPVSEARDKALKMATKLRHRGPDWSGIYSNDKAILAHERLSIVDVEHGAQPLLDKLTGNVDIASVDPHLAQRLADNPESLAEKQERN